MTRSLLLSGGPTHDFDATSASVARLLGEDGIETLVEEEPAAVVEGLRGAEAQQAPPISLLTVNALRWRMEQPAYAHLRSAHAHDLVDRDAAVIERFVHGGGGLLALHTAVICFDAQPRWRALCGASWAWGTSTHPPCGPAMVRVTDAGRQHEISAGLDDFVIDDEVYGFLDEVDGLVPLLVADHGGRAHPLLWAWEVGRGRVVTDLLGHGPASVEHPSHRTILRRAAAWAMGGAG